LVIVNSYSQHLLGYNYIAKIHIAIALLNITNAIIWLPRKVLRIAKMYLGDLEMSICRHYA